MMLGLWEETFIFSLKLMKSLESKPDNNAMLEFQEMIHAPLRNGACLIVDIKAANTRGVITNLGITVFWPVLIEHW